MVWTNLMVLIKKISCEGGDSITNKVGYLITGQTPRIANLVIMFSKINSVVVSIEKS